jgi:hypothetical protein
MSWIGVMVGVGVGAGSSGLMTGLNGGSTEDILKSMAIGGAMGGAGGGIGSALSGAAGGAAAGAGSGAASGGGTGATTSVLTSAGTGTLGNAGNVALASALPTSVGTVGGTTGAATGTVGGTGGGAIGGGTGGAGFAGINGGTGILAGGTGGATGGVGGGGTGSLGSAGNQAAASAFSPESVMSSSGTLPGQGGFVGPIETPQQLANVKAYESANMGTRLLADAFGQQGNIVGNTGLKMAGGALQGGAINAGIGGLFAGAQGKDVGEGMAKGAATGMIGGAATGAMSGMDNTVGKFATDHPYITSAGVGLAANMALDKPYEDTAPPTQPGIRSNVKWNPSVYRPYGPQFAAGGITDLDNYDQSPQMQSPGTLDIPSRNEVPNNQGYMGDSVQLMADGGVTKESFMLEGVGGKNLHREASQDLREFLESTPDSELTTAQQRQKQILFAKKMAMGGMAYNHGGISDLGGYSDGGRLLKGPGDGVSDDIPASIGGKQPARLAEGEFVIPSRIVSELGNGSTDAGAKRLYQMMDRIQSDRKKTTGKGKFSDNPKAYKHLPA